MTDINLKAPASEAVLKMLGVLVDGGNLDKSEVAALREKYSMIEDLAANLLSAGKIKENAIVEAYAKAKGIPFVELSSVDEKAIDLVDKDVARQFGFIPFAIDEKNHALQIAVTQIERFKNLNAQAVKALEQKLGYKIELFATTGESAQKVLSASDGKAAKIDLAKIDIEKDALKKIPLDVAEKYKAVIFRQSPDETLEVATINTKDKNLLDILSYVQKETGVKLRIFQAESGQIEQVLDKYRQMSEGLSSDVEEKSFRINAPTEVSPDEAAVQLSVAQTAKMENPDLQSFLGKQQVSLEDIKNFSNTGQVPQLLAAIIFMAIGQRSSDVHIEPFEKAIRVRYRVDGVLNDVVLLPIALNAHIAARVKILSKLKLDEQRVPQDGRFEIRIGAQDIDVRVSTLPTVFGEKVALRLLSKSKRMEDLQELGFDGINFDRTIEAISKPFGVVLLTGPTGSGKTTSLYSILYRLNKPQVNIVTLEDPVEYEIPGINQTQIKPQIGFGFAEGLRSVLRQDPNIIMVGEIRDHDTAELVTHAALTGHLVLSTLHTNDSASALPRLYDLGVEPFLITSSLNAVIAQRLVRRICPKCRYEVTLPQSVVFEVKKELEPLNLNQPIRFFKGKGCASCRDGFVGRVGIFETLSMTGKVEDLVLSKATSAGIFTEAVKEGMITIKQDGLIKAIKGITTVDEVLRVTSPI